jgi:uncharacterized protein (TIGR02284 family)
MRDPLRSDTAVQRVIEILIDSQDGLATVGERLRNQSLKQYFFTESLLRAQFIEELETALRRRGVNTFWEKGGAAASLHRTWTRIKSKFTECDHTLLETAEQGEDTVTEVYSRALETYLPEPIRQILTAQEAHIELVHRFLKTERDRPNDKGQNGGEHGARKTPGFALTARHSSNN